MREAGVHCWAVGWGVAPSRGNWRGSRGLRRRSGTRSNSVRRDPPPRPAPAIARRKTGVLPNALWGAGRAPAVSSIEIARRPVPNSGRGGRFDVSLKSILRTSKSGHLGTDGPAKKWVRLENRHTAPKRGYVYRRLAVQKRREDCCRGVNFAEPALDPGKLADEAGRASAGLQGPRSARRRRAAARRLPPARLRWGSAQTQTGPWKGRRRRGVPIAGWGLRGEFRRAFGRQYPRFLPRVSADGGGDDFRGRLPDRQGRARRRPIREAPLVRLRDDRWRHAAKLPRRHSQRHRVHGASA